MRTCRFSRGGRECYGVVDGTKVRALTAEPWSGGLPEGPAFELSEVDLLAPVVPTKVVCVGRNYRAHAAELGNEVPKEPLLFIKPSTAVIGPGATIEAPAWAGRIDHEAELGVVIGKTTRDVRAAKAYEHILGLTAVNDVTARDLQNTDGQYTRCKGFDTFAPVGPCVAVGLDGRDLQVQGYVNGSLRQNSRSRELIFTIPELVEFISSVMTLLPGDIISTGTPSGIGPIRPGDQVTVHVEGVGALTNPVAVREGSAT